MAEDRKTTLAEENANRARGKNDQEAVEAVDNSQVVDAGIPGQVQYPDRATNAERAAAFAAGKAETLYDPDEEPEDSDRQVYATHWDKERKTGDETGQETEPVAMRGGPGSASVEEEKR